MSQFLTPAEDICLSLIFECIGETGYDRTKVDEIGAKLPPLKVLHGYINDRLRERALREDFTVRILHFRKGDRKAWFAPYPTSVSIETVRRAETKSGLRYLRPRKGKKLTRILELYFSC